MSDQTIVSITQAAQMVGIARNTFYKHIKKKKITILDQDTTQPKVEVSELIRIYGNRVKTPEMRAEEEQKEKLLADPSVTILASKMELQALRTEINHLKELRQAEQKAFDQQNKQIELLKGLLDSEKEERRRTTALLTDQRGEKDKQAERLFAVERENAAMKNAGLFTRLFGFARKH
jgi:hypothetical protein